MAVSGANLAILLVLFIGPPGTALRVERSGLAPRLGLSLRMTALLGGDSLSPSSSSAGRSRVCCGPPSAA